MIFPEFGHRRREPITSAADQSSLPANHKENCIAGGAYTGKYFPFSDGNNPRVPLAEHKVIDVRD